MNSINILDNCHYSLPQIQRMWIGSRCIDLSEITYPIEYTTVNDTNDSVIAVNYNDALQTFTIGGQCIEVNEIVNTGENIQFNEEMVWDEHGKNFRKTITFIVPQTMVFTLNQIKEFVQTETGRLGLTNNIAFLLDENNETLVVGYDKPLILEELETIIGEENQYSFTYQSLSMSRARRYEII